MFSQVLQVVEGGLGGDAVHQDEALTVLHVQVPHGGELLGAGSVEDLEHALLAVDLDLLPVGVLDGGVVLLHEDALHKLHCQGGLPHTTRTQHHDLVFSHPALGSSDLER